MLNNINQIIKSAAFHTSRVLKKSLLILSLTVYFSSLAVAQTTNSCFKWIDWGNPIVNADNMTVLGNVGNISARFVSQRTNPSDGPLFVGGTPPKEGFRTFLPSGSSTVVSTVTSQKPGIQALNNRIRTRNTLSFGIQVKNPILAFSSVGNGSTPVTITFANNFTVLQRAGNTSVTPTSITGTEGDFLVQINGTYDTVTFDYASTEDYVQFVFGYNICDCGNGSAEPGEDCDLGDLNGNPAYGCSSSCRTLTGFSCSNGPSASQLATWKTQYEALLTKFADCITLPAAQLPTDPVCSTATTGEVTSFTSYRKYILGYTASCDPNTYMRMTLNNVNYNFLCTDDPLIKDYDRQLLSITTPEKYSATSPQADTACDSNTAVPLFTPNIALDSNVKSCMMHCDDQIDCKFVEHVTATNRCLLYSGCPDTTATPGTNLYSVEP